MKSENSNKGKILEISKGRVIMTDTNIRRMCMLTLPTLREQIRLLAELEELPLHELKSCRIWIFKGCSVGRTDIIKIEKKHGHISISLLMNGYINKVCCHASEKAKL